ncbi:MAG: four helix bundle protein [Ignavibacteriaceae bacterium]|jgi:four helix bundle protein
MEKTNFEKLDIYKLSEKLSDTLWTIILSWSPFAKTTIGTQIIKATDSIGANIAEGTGKGSSLDNKRFAKIARGSLFETKHWLRRAVKRNLLKKDEIDKLKEIVDELSPRLSAYINSIK